MAPLAGACKKKEADQGAGTGSEMAGTGTGTAAGTADMAGTGSGTGMGTGDGTGAGTGSAADTLMSRKGGNCPNLVAGATTKVTVDQKKFTATVEITATDKNAIATIQARAKTFKDRKKEAAPSGGTHDAKGSMSGDEGMCAAATPPFAVASSKDLKNGAQLVLKLDAAATKDASVSAKAFEEIQARADKGAAWVKDNLKLEPGGQGGTGAGSGKHGRDHSGKGDAKGMEEGGTGGGAGTGGGKKDGTGGGGGAGKSGGAGSGSATK